MKSPDQLAEKLSRQWQNPDTREPRLLEREAWPVELAIGKPTPAQLKQNLEGVRRHLEQWRNINIGQVTWEKIKYRDTDEAVELPICWRLNRPSEWVCATNDPAIKNEFQMLSHVISGVNPIFHPLLIRQRHLTADKPTAEIIQACELALQLEQNCAAGLPLRALSLAGIDSKFFERHRRLMIKLLDVKFDGLVSEIGLENYLGAIYENNHWLLVVDLDGTLLPFQQMRLRDDELKSTPLPALNILIIENERSLYQLPRAENTIAILGAGLNLSWMIAPWLNGKRIAYWGDIDTWGLTMLAQARYFQPTLTALLMGQELFEKYTITGAVSEPTTAGETPPALLSKQEKDLYVHLLKSEKGRLEQEFIAEDLVKEAITNWATL
jgi:hypothetical protein